jgi:hypothetical protein
MESLPIAKAGCPVFSRATDRQDVTGTLPNDN